MRARSGSRPGLVAPRLSIRRAWACSEAPITNPYTACERPVTGLVTGASARNGRAVSLRREPEGMQRAGAVAMHLHAHDLSPADLKLLRDAGLHGGAARLPCGGHADEDENSRVVDVEVALGLEVDRASPGPGVAKAAHLLETAQNGLVRIHLAEVELRVGGRVGAIAQGRGVEVCACDELDVLCRHEGPGGEGLQACSGLPRTVAVRSLAWARAFSLTWSTEGIASCREAPGGRRFGGHVDLRLDHVLVRASRRCDALRVRNVASATGCATASAAGPPTRGARGTPRKASAQGRGSPTMTVTRSIALPAPSGAGSQNRGFGPPRGERNTRASGPFARAG